MLKIHLLITVIILLSFTTAIAHVKSDDASDTEFGIWWVNDYSDNENCTNLNNADNEADAFSLKMVSEGYTRNFRLTNNDAQENHFSCSSVGGSDSNYADTCDFFYFAGHGSNNIMWFNEDNDGDGVYPQKVQAIATSAYNEPEWGDTDLEWAFLHACSCLASTWKAWWQDAFIGLHGICGADTEMELYSDGRTGNWTAYYLTDGGQTIHEAWKQATKKTQRTIYDCAIYRVKIKIDLFYYDYGDETIDDFLPDYGSGGVIKHSYLYTEWDCEYVP